MGLKMKLGLECFNSLQGMNVHLHEFSDILLQEKAVREFTRVPANSISNVTSL